MSAIRGNRRYRVAAIGTAALLAAGGFIMVQAVSAEAGGATRYVAPTGDDTENDCTAIASPCRTVQYAVNQADANDTVSIAPGTYDESVHIRISLTLVGAGTSGANKTTIDGDTESGDASIWIDGGDTDSRPTVTVSHLDVSNNQDNNGIIVDAADAVVKDSVVDDNENNGIIVENGSTLAMTDSTASHNGDNGVVVSGQTEIERPTGAKADVATAGSTTISNSDLSANSGAGVETEFVDVTVDSSTVNGNGNGGAVIGGGGTLTVNSSTLDGNHAAGAAAVAGGTLVVNKSTVSNSLPSNFEEEEALGAGIAGLGAGTVRVNDSTIYRSTNNGILSAYSDVTVKNSTVVGTRKVSGDRFGLTPGALAAGDFAIPTAGPAIRSLSPTNAKIAPQDSLPPSVLTVVGTIVSGNAVDDCSAGVVDKGYNLADDDTCDFGSTGTNSGDAKLGSFGQHGGPTKTLVPAKGSDAIDRIPAGTAGCTKSGTDQRGEARLQGPKCDIGSVEAHQTPIVISPSSLPQGAVNKAYAVTFTATGGLGAPYEFALAPGSHLPSGLSLSTAGVLSGTPTEAGTFTFTISVDDPTLKTYTLVITGGVPPLADTGTRVAPMVTIGSAALGLGILLMLAAGYTGGYVGRRRRQQ